MGVCACLASGVQSKSFRGSAAAVDSVATVENVGEFSLQKTISNIEQRLDVAEHHNSDDDEDDDVLPAVASEMGVGQCVTSTIWCHKNIDYIDVFRVRMIHKQRRTRPIQ